MQPAPEITGNENTCASSMPDQAKRIPSLLNKLFLLIPIGVGGNIIFLFVFTDHEMFGSVRRFSPAYFCIALLLSIVPWFTGSLRMFLWSRFLGKAVRYRDMFNIALGAELGAAVSPPLVGGGPVKIWMLMQQGFSGGKALSLSFLEIFEDSVFFLVMVPVALTVSKAWDLPVVRNAMSGFGYPSFWVFLLLAGLLLCAGMLLARYRFAAISDWFPVVRTILIRIKTSFGQFVETYQSIAQKGKTIFALTMALTTVQWVCRYSIISLLLLSLGIPPRPVLFMAFQVIIFALLAFVPTPGGAGGAEALFYVFYQSFLPANAIGLIVAGWRFITFYFLLFVASGIVLLSRIKPTVPISVLPGE